MRIGIKLTIGIILTGMTPVAATSRPEPQTVPLDKGRRSASSNQDEIIVTGERMRSRSDWVRAESPNFTVYGVDEGQTRQVAAKLERFRQFLMALTRTPSPAPASPVPVYLVKGRLQLDRLRRERYERGTYPVGYYSASPTGLLLAADMNLDARRNIFPLYHDASLFGDFTYQFLLQNARGAYIPAWYIDGLGVNLTTTRFTEGSVEFGKANPDMAEALSNRKWEPIGRIVSGELSTGWLYSAESALLVHYICAEPARVKAFQRFLTATRDGKEGIAAFEQAFATTMKALQAKLWQYRTSARYIRASTTVFTVPDISVYPLPKSADALLLDRAAMQIGIPERDRQSAVLRRAESVATDPKDGFAQRILAKARILYGAPERADPILDRLLAASSEDTELMYLKGMRHLMAGRADPAIARDQFREARTWFAHVYRVDPDYYPALYAWAESRSTEPRFVSENTVNVLMKAVVLAPQATQIRITAATMMLQDGRFNAAEALLAPVIVTPQDPASEQVPALLQKARMHEPAAMQDLLASFRYEETWKDRNCC
jgi:tetratricopeptide (TPR) repeat protein